MTASLDGRRALVTGGSRGIGAEIVRRLAADGAVASLTRGLARELGPRGITVNNVQPGPIATDMNPEDGEFAEWARPMTSLGRYGQTSDIASAVSYLAGPEASFVTGPTGTSTAV